MTTTLNNLITRSGLQDVLDYGGAIAISPDSVVTYITDANTSETLIDVLQNANYTILGSDNLQTWAAQDKYKNDTYTFADDLNRLYGLGDYEDLIERGTSA